MFKKIYPNRGKLVFDGGKNSKYEKSLIEDNESPSCANVIFNAGSVGTRDGFSKVNTASVGTYVCDGIYSRQGQNSSDTMVAFFGGHGFTLVGTSFSTIPSAQSIYTAGTRIAGAQMENHLFVNNGNVIPYKYNGVAFTRHGIYPPTDTASYVTGAGGNPNGAYSYKFTYVNSASVESDASTFSTTLTVAASKIEISSIPVAAQSFGVNSRNIYRTVASGATFFRVGSISDNTTTVFSDNIADASLGALAPVDKGVPPKYTTIIYHKNRLFMNDTANPQFIWYTDIDEPYTVGPLSFLTLGDGSTDLVKALGIQDSNLVVFCERSPWIVYMADTNPANWRIVRAKSDMTTKSPFGIFNYNNKLAFPAVQNDTFIGISALASGTQEPTTTYLTLLAAGGVTKSDRVEPDMFDMADAYVGNFSAIVHKNRALISMTKTAGNTLNNIVYVMDFSNSNLSDKQTESWCPYTGLNVAQFVIHNGLLYYGTSTATGFVYQESPGVYSDDGSAIDSYFWTKEFSGSGGEESYSKDFRFTNILVDLAGNYNMILRYRTNSDSGVGTSVNVNLNPNASLWGVMKWGIGTWGGGDFQGDIRIYLATLRGKRVQFMFSNGNTANQRFKVHHQNFTYNLKGQR